MNYRLDSPDAIRLLREATGRSEKEVRDLIAHYDALHWGIPPDRVININDPLVPDCAGMGALVAVYVITGQGEYRALDFPDGSYLGVEEPKNGRLHLIAPAARKDAKRNYDAFLRTYPGAAATLEDVAQAAPGRQNRFPWPKVKAMLLGVITHILYRTDKLGDGMSTYIHAFGEDTGKHPNLAADAAGRFWVAGGDYYTPPEGITN